MVKGPKDANAPKKPKNPYMAFREKNYKRIVKSMPTGYSFGELARKISTEWNNLGEAEKQVFKDTHAEQSKKWQKLFNAYKLTGNYQKFLLKKKEFKADKTNKKNKFPKDENAPKKAATAYFCFMADKRQTVKAQNPTVPHKELVTKMAKMWNELSEGEKKPYETESAKKKKAYQKELAAYKESDEFKQYQKEKLEHQQSLNSAKKVKAPKMEKTEKKKSKKKTKKSKSPKKSTKAKKAKKAKGGKKPKAPKKSARKAAKPARKAAKSARKATKSARKATKSKKATKPKNATKPKKKAKTARK